MPKKKTSSTKRRVQKKDKEDTKKLDETLMKQILEALKSPALNGGFDTLLHKVDNIETSQGHTQSKVDKLCKNQQELSKKLDDVHDAMYHPDKGLFARQKSTEAANDTLLASLGEWRKNVDQELERDHVQDQETLDKLAKAEKQCQANSASVDQITSTLNNFKSGIKWFIAAVGGGGITLAFKLLYDVIQ